MNKIGIVVEGGGMKCAYSAAVLDKFLDDHITFDYGIGVSAGSANLASYFAGQRDRNKRFYIEHLKDKEYFGTYAFLKTGNLFNLDYIYSTLTNTDGKDPLDFQAVLENPVEFVIVATDASTGKPHYFHKEEMSLDDYSIIKASCALPAACKPQKVNGHYYVDGGVSDSIPVERAIKDGCDKLVVILSKPRDFIKEPENLKPLYTALCRKYPRVVRALNRRHLTYKRCQNQMFSLEQAGKCFIIAPSAPPEMSTYSMDPVVEQELYDLGLADYEAQKEALFAFLQNEVN